VETGLKSLSGANARMAIAVLLAATCVGSVGLAIGSRPEPQLQPSQKSEEPGAKRHEHMTDLHGDPLPLGALRRLGTVRLRHKESVSSVAFSPDRRLVAAGTDSGVIQFWDAATGKEARRIEGHDDRLTSLAFSPDGKLLASAGSKSIYLWDVTTGKGL